MMEQIGNAQAWGRSWILEPAAAWQQCRIHTVIRDRRAGRHVFGVLKYI